MLLKSIYKYNSSIFYIFYILTETKFNKIKDNYNIISKQFNFKNKKYIMFYVNGDLIINNNIILHSFTYRINDNYIINTKNNYLDIINIQSFDRNNIFGNISSIDFAEIASNKILYTKFLLNMKIVDNKTIIYNTKINLNKYYNYIIKLPYSNTSTCVFYKNKNIKKKKININQCFLKEGYIIEPYNYSKGELKIMTLYGKIEYIIYYYNNKKYYISNKFTSDNNNIIKYIKPYKDKIEIFIKKIYKTINLLIQIKKHKINNELKLYNKLKIKNKVKENLITSLFYNLKIDYINTLQKYDTIDLLKLLKQSFYDYYIQNKSKFSNTLILDPYMRIDIKLPDNKNYKNIMLVELDTYSSGKGKDITNNYDFNNFYFITKIMSKHYNEYKRLVKNSILNK